MNQGMKVTIRHKDFGTVTLRNVTEIHYGYPSAMLEGEKVAFESDIHGTGMTYAVKNVIEFETSLETEKSESF